MNQSNDGSHYQAISLPVSEKPHLSVVGREAVEDGQLQWARFGPQQLELGGHLPSATVAYRTWGQLNEAGDNAVLVLHALTGDSEAGNEDGWWSPLIGPDKALDTDRAFVVCANILGGCQGTTGPASINPLTGRPYAMNFPLVTIGDMVNLQRQLVESLGVTRLTAIGGSIGGFQAMEWASRHPDLVTASMPIAATPALGPLQIALNEAGRRAIMNDPDWRGGEYASEGVFPAEGLAIARMIAMTTFQSAEGMDSRFGRRPATRPTLYPSFGGTFEVEGYIHYHGAKLVRRFDANSHLYLTRAMDLYDLYRNGGAEHWIGQIQAPVQLIGIRTDWLYPPEGVERFARDLAAAGVEVDYTEFDSHHGHDAFLMEWQMLDDAIRPFVDRHLPESVE